MIRVPDIGDFKSVPVIEIHVAPGDASQGRRPAAHARDRQGYDGRARRPTGGTVADVKVKIGDRVSEGDLILRLRTGARQRRSAVSGDDRRCPAPAPAAQAAQRRDAATYHAEVLVLGGGARRLHGGVPRRRSRQAGRARRALADARRRVPQCRLHPFESAAARRQGDRRERMTWARNGITFAAPQRRRRQAARAGRTASSSALPAVSSGLAKARKVTVVEGIGKFVSLNQVEVQGKDGGDQDRKLRAGDHRGRLGAGDAALHPAPAIRA